MSKHIEPALGAASFSCPHCGAIAQQYWHRLYLKGVAKGSVVRVFKPSDFADVAKASDDDEIDDDEATEKLRKFLARLKKHMVTYGTQRNNEYLSSSLVNVATSQCYSCDGFSLWVEDKIVYPAHNSTIVAHDEMPDSVKADFNEAASIVDLSARGAAGLLRLCIQKSMMHLGLKGKKIDDDIAELVKRGLDTRIQKALDIVRVIGNEAVHPGTIDLRDDKSTAIELFALVNLIVETMIAQPKHIERMYDALPASKREAIEKRDKKLDQEPK